MKIAYFDCFAGASGDMIAAAMIDAGLDAEFLKAQLATLGIAQLDVKLAETHRGGLRALRFEPVVEKQHEHRNPEQIAKIINRSGISLPAKKTALAVFDRLAEAEATVHGKDTRDVHFHEIGAIDSIVDIVSASVGLDYLGIDKVYCSPLSVGGGTIKCEHGLLPVPAPATAHLLKGIPIAAGPAQLELLTPTAAAILTTITDQFCPLPSIRIEAVGYGAGAMNPAEFPNVLRLILGRPACEDSADTDTVCLLETNVDDATGELVGFVCRRLFEHGALDVFTTPIFMKQNRPAVQVSVICRIEDTAALEKVLFEEAVTLGIRKQILQRSKLKREFANLQTEFGQIRVKIGLLNGRIVNVKPELSDCEQTAKKHNVSVCTVLRAALAAFEKSQPRNSQ